MENDRYPVCFADAEDIRWIAELHASQFRQPLQIGFDTMFQWYSANPYGFFVIKTDSGSRVGCAIILAMRPPMLSRLIEGTIVKKDICKDHLYPPEEKHSVNDLYVALMMIKLSRLTSMYLSFHILLMIDKICVPENVRHVYLNVATPMVEKTVKSMGGVLVKEGAERADGLNLYCLDYQNSVEKVIRRHERRLQDMQNIFAKRKLKL